MSISSFVSQVFTPTEKDILIKGLEQNIEDHAILGMELAEFGEAPFRPTRAYMHYDRVLKTNPHASGVYKGDLVRFLTLTIEKIEKNRPDYIKMIEGSFDREITRNGLDYRRIHLLQLCAAIDAFYDIVTKWIAVASAESVQDLYAKTKLIDQYRKEIMHDNTIRALGFIIKLVHTEPSKLDGLFKQMKDIPYIEDRASDVERTYKDRLDPMSTNIAPVFGHIAVFIGSLWNSWIAYRRDRAKEILKQVRMDQIYRKRAMENASPEELKQLKEQIKAGDRRIIKLEQKIKDMEDGV